jgi:hypothetical protein
MWEDAVIVICTSYPKGSKETHEKSTIRTSDFRIRSGRANYTDIWNMKITYVGGSCQKIVADVLGLIINRAEAVGLPPAAQKRLRR